MISSSSTCDAGAGQRGDPAGLGRLGDAGEQRERLVAAAVGDEQLGQRDDRGLVVRLELERLAQRGLVAGVEQRAAPRSPPRSGRSVSTNARTSASALGADEAVDDLAVDQGVHRRDALHLEGLGHAGVVVDVDLGQHDLAVGVGDDLLDDRTERPARAAPRRPQVDDHGHLGGAVEDLGLERGVGDVDVGGRAGEISVEVRHDGPRYGRAPMPAAAHHGSDDRGRRTGPRAGPPAGARRCTSTLGSQIATRRGTRCRATRSRGSTRSRSPRGCRSGRRSSRRCSFDLIAGGHSNLTFRVTDAGRHPVGAAPAAARARCSPPPTTWAASTRSSRPSPPPTCPVAPAVGLCTDEAVNGAPFYVMDFVDGTVVRDARDGQGHRPRPSAARAGESIVDVLARIHAVDVDAVGLGDLGKQRGLHRPPAQALVRPVREVSKTRELPVVDEVHDLLAAPSPSRARPAIVHGDYRLDNCMVGDDGQVVAVLDWEICTLGDPLADVGLLLVYWPDEAGDLGHRRPGAPRRCRGFPSQQRDARPLRRTSPGRDLTHIDFYVAFGYWKLACILEGVYARYVGGAMGGKGEPGSFDFFGQQVVTIFERAREAATRVA